MGNRQEQNPKINENAEEVDKKEQVHVQPPDGGWGWMVVFASLVASLLSDGVIYSYGVLTPEFIKHYDLSRSAVGWMGSILVATTLAVGPLASYLCKKLGYRACGVIGSLISAISFALPYFYSELWFLILCSSVICGVGFGLVYLPSIIIVNVWFDKKRALAMGIAVCGSGLGTFVMSPLIEFLISTYGWQLTMLAIGGILLLMIPCCLTYTNVTPKSSMEVDLEKNERDSNENNTIERNCAKIEMPSNEDHDLKEIANENNINATECQKIEMPSYEGEDLKVNANENKINKTECQKIEMPSNEGEDLEMKELNASGSQITKTAECEIIQIPMMEEKGNPDEKKSFIGMMKDFIFLLFLVSNILSSIGFNAPYMYAKDRAILQGISDSKGSFLISSIGIGNCIGRLLFGFLATLNIFNRFHLFNVAVILSGVSLIASWIMTNYISMIAYTLMFGMMSGAFVTLTSVILIDLFGLVNVDKAFSITLVVQGLSVLIGPPFAGFIYDSTLSFNASFAVCGGSIALSGLIMYLSYFSKEFRKKTFK